MGKVAAQLVEGKVTFSTYSVRLDSFRKVVATGYLVSELTVDLSTCWTRAEERYWRDNEFLAIFIYILDQITKFHLPFNRKPVLFWSVLVSV